MERGRLYPAVLRQKGRGGSGAFSFPAPPQPPRHGWQPALPAWPLLASPVSGRRAEASPLFRAPRGKRHWVASAPPERRQQKRGERFPNTEPRPDQLLSATKSCTNLWTGAVCWQRCSQAAGVFFPSQIKRRKWGWRRGAPSKQVKVEMSLQAVVRIITQQTVSL